ncbi:MAG: hypothetical protein HQL68_02320 [Magnetococcales bacterium]|nr:hypothetical protein [Magnetococcales bacterium]
MFSWRELRFVLCTIAVFMIYKIIGTGWLFNVAGANALINLFTGQYLCTTNSCSMQKPGITLSFLPFKMRFSTDPISIAHYITTIFGLLLFIYGGWQILM